MKPTASFLIGSGLLLLLGAAPKTHGQAPADESKQKPATTASQPAGQVGATDAEYKIGPQDVLRIDVWKEPEISRTAPVRPDGRITLPLVNDVQAAGLTSTQLATVIADGLRKFLTNPQVTVYVTGEVTRPGAFPLLPNMTVLQALSSSGGFSQFAKLKGIYVLRTEDGKQVKHPFNYKEVVSGKKPELNILLQPGDVIVVP